MGSSIQLLVALLVQILLSSHLESVSGFPELFFGCSTTLPCNGVSQAQAANAYATNAQTYGFRSVASNLTELAPTPSVTSFFIHDRSVDYQIYLGGFQNIWPMEYNEVTGCSKPPCIIWESSVGEQRNISFLIHSVSPPSGTYLFGVALTIGNAHLVTSANGELFTITAYHATGRALITGVVGPAEASSRDVFVGFVAYDLVDMPQSITLARPADAEFDWFITDIQLLYRLAGGPPPPPNPDPSAEPTSPGGCRDNCDIEPTSQIIPDVTQPTSVTIVGGDGSTVVATIEIPANAFTATDNVTWINVSNVPIALLNSVSNPYLPDITEYTQYILAPPLQIEAEGVQIPFNLPVTISFGNTLSQDQLKHLQDNNGLCLGVINTDSLQWECRDSNLQYDATSNSLSGQTTTFSNYALLVTFDDNKTQSSSSGSEGNNDMMKILAGVIAGGVVLIVIVILVSVMVVGYRRRRQQHHKLADRGLSREDFQLPQK